MKTYKTILLALVLAKVERAFVYPRNVRIFLA
jgi:hypothetical protein